MKKCALLHRDIIPKHNWNKTERLKRRRNKRNGGERSEDKARIITCARSGNVLLLVVRESTQCEWRDCKAGERQEPPLISTLYEKLRSPSQRYHFKAKLEQDRALEEWKKQEAWRRREN
jgi:hypothetical protein